MKNLLFFLFLSTTLAFSNNVKPVTTSIKAVTVYVNGAEVTRIATITLPEGTTEFTFDKLSPLIQENSIQVSGLKNASILSIKYGINYITKQDKSENIELFQNQIKGLNDAIQFEDDLIAGYEEELKVIHDNRHIGNDNQAVTLEKLQQFADYYRKRITKIKNLIYASSKKKGELNIQINDIKKQLNELNIDDKLQTGEIKIKLNTSSSNQLNLVLKYNVTNAGWFPVYDLKAEEINKPLLLDYKAHVYQNTGANWDNIKLTLSTSDPYTNNTKPEVNPKYLSFTDRYQTNFNRENATKKYSYQYNPFIQNISGIITDETGTPLPGANIIIKGTNNGTTSNFDGEYSIQTNGGKDIEFSYVGYKTESIPIHSSIINLSLQEDAAMLEEVVVVGYGIENKTTALAGKISGIQVRGSSSMKSYNKPLYVLDGTIINENEFKNIAPNRIANIETLKGESATNIYGNRASNGVIVATTKKENYTATGDIISEGISNTNFEIKKQYSIPSDGDLTVIEIDKFEVPASYSYFAAPIVNENVFLTAKIGEWQQYNLLPGEANIYFEGSYSGKTNINPYATTDSLTVSLGVDPNVIIKRNATNNYKKINFIGSNKIVSKSYEIELKNNKKSAIDLILMDRIPISQNKDIKVDDLEYGDADYDSKKGLLKWKLNIKSNQSNTYKFSYVLKYPKYKSLNL